MADDAINTEKFMAAPVTSLEELKKNSDSMLTKMELMIMKTQYEFCKALEALEPTARFLVDKWDKPNDTGGGITCVLQDGEVFEKAGVGVSVVRGQLSVMLEQKMKADRGKVFQRFDDGRLPFVAMGVSSVVHPTNPHCPTVHFNYRYFEVTDAAGVKTWWFGGGTDLTPMYVAEDDFRHFHGTLKRACDAHDAGFYPRYKKWCDEYFRIIIRDECRGVGGLFMDDVAGDDPQRCFAFISECAATVVPCYLPIVQRNMRREFTEHEKQWQQVRRGRYVEFNLIYDRGTKFGFLTPGARIESILMSMPLTARWQYMHVPEEGSREHAMVQVLKEPREWA